MLILLVSAALAGTNTHTDGTTTIVRDGNTVISVETADGALERFSEDGEVTMLLAGDVEIDGTLLTVGEELWLDLGESKALGVAWKDKDRSFAVADLLDDGGKEPVAFNLGVVLDNRIINLSVGWIPLCATEDGFGLGGELWGSDDSIIAVELDAGLMGTWTAPQAAGDPMEWLGHGEVEDLDACADGEVSLETVKDQTTLLITDAKGTTCASTALEAPAVEMVFNFPDSAEVACGALLDFQIPEK